MATRIPTTIPTSAAAVSARTSAILPYIVAATFFMEYLDTTVIATALPEMARSFAVGPNDVSMGMTAYMLTLAVFIPISGWVADRLGSRTVYGGALVLFTLASVLCGLSSGLTAFTAARVLQGIGGALMVPVGRMIVVRNTEKSRLLNAISTITWPAIVAPVVGPTVGGFITTYASWHWVFFLNIPFGCLALIAIAKVVPNQRGAKGRPLDLVGFLLSGTALICLLYGTELASRQGTSFLTAVGFMSAGILIGVVTVRHLLTVRHPLLDLSALALPTFAVTVLWGTATRIGIEAVPYLSPLLLQLGFGLSAFHAGLLLLATATGNLGMKVFTTRILNRFGFRTVATVNVTAAALAITTFALLVPASPLALTLGVLFVYGVTRSMQFTTLATLAYADVGDAKTAAASTLWSVAQQMTIGMGIAFGAVGLRFAAYLSTPSGGNPGTRSVGRSFTVADFHWAFAAAGVLVLCSVIGYYRLPRDAGTLLAAKKGAT
jgi:EmrB/QacA subfamily drug resistance transporter